MSDFATVKGYLSDFGLKIVHEDAAEHMIVAEDEEQGIKNLLVVCEPPIVILEQVILSISKGSEATYKRLLQLNRKLVHGAFVLDDAGVRVLFRDTLQLENLDFNELEGSINALSLAMAEHSAELLSFGA